MSSPINPHLAGIRGKIPEILLRLVIPKTTEGGPCPAGVRRHKKAEPYRLVLFKNVLYVLNRRRIVVYLSRYDLFRNRSNSIKGVEADGTARRITRSIPVLPLGIRIGPGHGLIRGGIKVGDL
jgi:hypothetical protein